MQYLHQGMYIYTNVQGVDVTNDCVRQLILRLAMLTAQISINPFATTGGISVECHMRTM